MNSPACSSSLSLGVEDRQAGNPRNVISMITTKVFINKKIALLTFLSFILILMPTTTSARENSGDQGVLFLDPNTSLVLPYFDTSSIANSNIDSITLSLYVLDKIPDASSQIHITINPVDLNTNQVGDGLSTFVDVSKDSYVDFRLPRELFEQTLRTSKRLLVRLVSKDQKIVLKGPDEVGTTLDPRLTVEHSELNEKEVLDQPQIVENNYYNIENSKLTFIEGDNNITDSQITVNNDGGFLWWLEYLILPLIVALIARYLIYRFGWIS